MADHIQMAGNLADGVSVGLGVASTIVQVVHDLVRDAIGDIVGKMGSAALQVVFSLGFATPKVIADILALVNKWVGRLTTKVKELVRSIDALQGLFKKIDPILDKLKHIFDNLGNARNRVDDWAQTTGASIGQNFLPQPKPTPFAQGVRFFGEDQLAFYVRDDATLGVSGNAVFMMPYEDAAQISSGAQAAIEAGLPRSATAAAVAKPVYGAVIPVADLPQRLPTVDDAGGWQHFLPGGHTAINVDGHFFPNATREFVVPGGGPLPVGSYVFEIDDSTGNWIPIGMYGGGS
jgi:hypothetical protein